MKCPTCDKPVDWKDNPFRPFCSERCKLIDLGRWVSEEYRVPGEKVLSNTTTNHSGEETSESEQ
jgi:hypothetical protein